MYIYFIFPSKLLEFTLEKNVRDFTIWGNLIF